MNEVSEKPRHQDAAPQRRPSLDQIMGVLWRGAVDALVKSLFVLVFGGIAIALASSIWRPMTPSRPPGFTGDLEAQESPAGISSSWGNLFTQHRFLIVFAVIFIPTIWARLANLCRQGEESKAASRLRRLGGQLSGQWFSLIVLNAFGALISATLLIWLQQLWWSRMLAQWLIASGLGEILGAIRHLLGSGLSDAFQTWWGWYGQNELRFTFWFFYLAAICDDLGIPNFKTLGRRLVRRVRGRAARKTG